MVNPRDLIRIALYLASGELNDRVGRPRQTELSRAISCAYYALFYTLARCCADTLVGVSPAGRSQGAWRQTYRALEHGPARSRCLNQKMLNRFPEEIQDFGRLFVGVQRERHSADYNPDARFSRSDVIQMVEETAGTIARFNRDAIRDRRAFAVYVLFNLRQD